MFETEKLTNNTDIYDELSLESILAEYADFDADKAAERDTAERSKQIIYESIGETEFSGGFTSDEAEATADAYYPEPEPEPEPEQPKRDYRRAAGRYTRRLRRGLERFGRREDVSPEQEFEVPSTDVSGLDTERPSGTYFDEDDDVKVYSPSSEFAPPEGDEDVKVYGGVDGVIAEAERRSARWNRGGHTYEDFGSYSDSGVRSYAAEASVPDGDVYGDLDTDAFSASGEAGEYSDYYDYDPDGGVREYGYDSSQDGRYASPDSENAPRDYGRAPKAGPVLGFLAALGVRLRNAQTAGEAVAPEDAEDMGEELPPKKAAKYYSGSVNSLRVRFRLSLVPAAALLWISLGLPAFGALGTGLKVTSLVCLVLQLSLVMLGLDIFTAGIMSLVRGRPGILSLAAVANIAAALDAATSYAVGTAGWGCPMCGAAGLAMLFALWGALLEARALRFSAKARELAEDASGVYAERGVEGREGSVLIKSANAPKSWLRRCEEPDAVENFFSSASPWLLLAALILSAAATAITGRWTYFFRILAAATACTAPFAAFFACALPYFLLALRAYRHGAAVAGWPGMRDIGRAVGMVVTDSDLFPADSIKISSIRILDGARPEDIISDAGSVVIASGSGLASAFTELLRRNGCALRRVENFCCHEGGGLTALIAGEEVLCGSAGFMRLMGVLVPQKLADKSAVFVSVNGELSGIFTIEYTPVPSVGKALFGCLRNRRSTIFAVRDFLVTPLLLHRKYKVPTEGFDFPLFSERYAVSAVQPEDDNPACALLGREGLGGFMEISGCGRRCYLAAMLGTVLSAAASVAGVLLAFALYAFGGGLGVNWLIAYMALWLIPSAIASVASAH